MKPHLGFEFRRRILLFTLIIFSVSLNNVHSQSSSNDAAVMQALKKNLQPLLSSLDWSDSNPCNWDHVRCSKNNRVTGIQLGHQKLTGELPQTLNNLTEIQIMEFQFNQLSGPLPSFSGLTHLHTVLLNDNNFSSFPMNFFDGMYSLQKLYLDYNAFSPWSIPESLKTLTDLEIFSATSTNLAGKIPDFFDFYTFPGLTTLRLAHNFLEGGLPESFSGSSIQSLRLNGQKSSSRLNGSIGVLQNMTELTEVWLHGNLFSGGLPDFSGLNNLQNLSLRDNSFTGPVPESLLGLKSLKSVNLTGNMLQGPMPKFNHSVSVDMIGIRSFCLPIPGVACDRRVNLLLAVAESVGYPEVFADNWKGNDPCNSWIGITCSKDGNITVINLRRMGLTGTISSNFSGIKSLKRLILADNSLTGAIPIELKDLPNLEEIDVSNNQLSGQVPHFRENVKVKTQGNANVGKDVHNVPNVTPVIIPNSTDDDQKRDVAAGGGKTPVNRLLIVGSVIGVLFAVAVFLGVLLIFCVCKSKKKRSGSGTGGSDGDGVKITIADSQTGSPPSGQDNTVISLQVLKNATDNFSPDNIIGKGRFGTVYKGELHEGTKIAIKRIESGVITEKGLDEFQSEISILTTIQHDHLVALLGYYFDAEERLLVYEYMPQGTLNRFLFNPKNEDLRPLLWSERLGIALDVARGVEYLHGLENQIFVNLKPSNILLGDDLHAKVADFGLIRLVPNGKASVATRLGGTFGYLAPEYAVMGRVTTKTDVFSFGVILMELITGRQALEETQPDDHSDLVQWFRKMYINKDAFRNAVDPLLDLDEDGLASVTKVANLAGHCCAREPYKRPDMSHVVDVLSSLTKLQKLADDIYGIDLNTILLEGKSGFENTQTSIPIGDSFLSQEGR